MTHDYSELPAKIECTTEAMASLASVPMDLWCEHSNACLEAATAIRALVAENERLREALKETVKQLDHDAPSNCWSTGPTTMHPTISDAIEDYIVCPGCRAIHQARAALRENE